MDTATGPRHLLSMDDLGRAPPHHAATRGSPRPEPPGPIWSPTSAPRPARGLLHRLSRPSHLDEAAFVSSTRSHDSRADHVRSHHLHLSGDCAAAAEQHMADRARHDEHTDRQAPARDARLTRSLHSPKSPPPLRTTRVWLPGETRRCTGSFTQPSSRLV